MTTAYGGGVTITIGPGSVATHGSLAAFGEAHARDGRLPWRELVAPAVDVARGGFRLGSASRYYLDHVHETVFGWDPASHARPARRDGRLTTEPRGRRRTSPPPSSSSPPRARARSTRATSPHSSRADVQARGGLLGAADLAAYAPVVRAPLTTRVGGWSLATTPPPSVGGVVVASMLRLLDGRPHGGWDDDDVEHLVRVQRAVLGHRREVLETAADLDAASRAWLDRVDADHRAVLESGSTAHVSVTDAEGAACSITVSSGYGAGMIAAGTGIWLNNCLGEQELNPPGRPRRARLPAALQHGADGRSPRRRLRPWRSAPRAPTGSPPRSSRPWPASSAAASTSRPPSRTRACTSTGPACPTRRCASRTSCRCTTAASAPRSPAPTGTSRRSPTRGARVWPGSSAP